MQSRGIPRHGYDFLEKSIVRDIIATTAKTAFANPEAVNVLLMPSLEGYDLNVFREAGFKKFYCVERNKEIFQKATWTKDSDITAFNCNVEVACKLLAEQGVQIHVAFLDFCGALSDSVMKAVEKISNSGCLAEKFVLSLTLMKGRETSEAAALVSTLAHISDRQPIAASFQESPWRKRKGTVRRADGAERVRLTTALRPLVEKRAVTNANLLSYKSGPLRMLNATLVAGPFVSAPIQDTAEDLHRNRSSTEDVETIDAWNAYVYNNTEEQQRQNSGCHHIKYDGHFCGNSGTAGFCACGMPLCHKHYRLPFLSEEQLLKLCRDGHSDHHGCQTPHYSTSALDGFGRFIYAIYDDRDWLFEHDLCVVNIADKAMNGYIGKIARNFNNGLPVPKSALARIQKTVREIAEQQEKVPS